jgi:general secretion pathway protein G
MRLRIKLPHTEGKRDAGFTLIELILTCGILVVLSAAAIPLMQVTIQHRRERLLRYELREIRTAIDRYKQDADNSLILTEVGSQNYPPDLQTLVDGAPMASGSVGAGGTPAGISASALAAASGTAQFGSAGIPQQGSAQSQGGQSLSAKPNKVRYLRKIPDDPMTGKADWGLRAVQDDPDSDSWGGKNVFDIYSQSRSTSSDGTTKYSEW